MVPELTDDEHIYLSSRHHLADPNLWHQRCGHASLEYLHRLGSLALGAPRLPTNKSLNFCPSCAAVKQTRTPVPRVRLSRAVTPFHTVGTDLAFVPVFVNGSRVSIVFIDEHTRFAARYFLRNKSSEACTVALQRYLTEVVCAAGYRLNTLFTDRGQAFFGSVTPFCQEHGIRLRRSIPYERQLNGLAERANRTHAEMARAMMVHALRSWKFWELARRAAVYITNRLPTVSHPGFASPFQQVTGELTLVILKFGVVLLMNAWTSGN